MTIFCRTEQKNPTPSNGNKGFRGCKVYPGLLCPHGFDSLTLKCLKLQGRKAEREQLRGGAARSEGGVGGEGQEKMTAVVIQALLSGMMDGWERQEELRLFKDDN